MDMMAMQGMSQLPQLQAQAQQVATEADMAVEDRFAEMAPEGKYSQKALVDFTKALNKALEIFRAEPLPLPEADIEGKLPTEHIRAVVMINDAMEAAKTGEPIDLAAMTDDKSLKMAAGKLDAASKDKALLAFINAPLPEAMSPEGEEVEMEAEMTEEVPEGMHMMPDGTMMPDSEMEDEELMMSRMR
jgi:hypothetical protein